jgi:hypothetical protein
MMREVASASADHGGVRLFDARRRTREANLAQVGAPFTAQEVHQLAFGLPEQWLGVINRDRWRAHGAAVMAEWASRVEAEQALFERESAEPGFEGREAPSRAQPWPVTFYGQPDPPGK